MELTLGHLGLGLLKSILASVMLGPYEISDFNVEDSSISLSDSLFLEDSKALNEWLE